MWNKAYFLSFIKTKINRRNVKTNHQHHATDTNMNDIKINTCLKTTPKEWGIWWRGAIWGGGTGWWTTLEERRRVLGWCQAWLIFVNMTISWTRNMDANLSGRCSNISLEASRYIEKRDNCQHNLVNVESLNWKVCNQQYLWDYILESR